ncbi:MAG TPA: hypothetical protein VJA25_12250, partial [Dehalococcoidia bacterium]|nr:hypothetical protein [Dehalococcoidia bacterium]
VRLPGTVDEDCQYTSYLEVLSGLVVQAGTVRTSGEAPLLEVIVRVWPAPVPLTIRTAPPLRAPAVQVTPVGIDMDVAPPAEAVPVCLRRYTQQLWYSLVVIAEPNPMPANTPDVPDEPSLVLVIEVGHWPLPDSWATAVISSSKVATIAPSLPLQRQSTDVGGR